MDRYPNVAIEDARTPKRRRSLAEALLAIGHDADPAQSAERRQRSERNPWPDPPAGATASDRAALQAHVEPQRQVTRHRGDARADHHQDR